MSSPNCRRITDVAILCVYALFVVALFQMDFSNVNGRRRRRIKTSAPSIAQSVSGQSNLPFLPEGEVCQQSQCTPFRQINSSDQQFRALQHIFTGNGILALSNATITNAPNDYAICEFQNMDAYNFHFPHTMQQLYRCWSWWRLRRTRFADETPVLIFPRSTMPENEFLQGFVAALQARIGLEVWTPQQFHQKHRQQHLEHNMVQPRVPNNRVDPVNIFGMQDPTRPYYALHQVDDGRVLRDTILGRPHRADDDGQCGDSTGKPRIAILNRHAHREWLNADAVAERLLQYAAKDEIPIAFFESNTTFIEQISFFRHVDVLLSPHGAQLTGLPFMPDCGSVLEVFPAGYYLPHFFGSLALASNLRHGYISLTQTGDWRAESVQVMPNQTARQRVRNQQLCPDVDVIEDGVTKLIDGWKKCCRATQGNGKSEAVAKT